MCSTKTKLTDDQPVSHGKSLCKPYHDNQITPMFNDINVYGGHKNKDVLQTSQYTDNSFLITYAFIKSDPIGDVFHGKDDVGLLIADKPLFHKDKLQNTKPLDRPPIVPICLAAKDANFNNEKIMGVGWGFQYEESPASDPTRDPYVSSCMTNEVGPEKWRFEACNMQFIKENNWSCEKQKYPPNILGDIKLCNALFG